MDYLDNNGVASASLPIEQDSTAAKRSVEVEKNRFHNRVQSFWRAVLVGVSLFFIQLLECTLPWFFKRSGDPELGGETRGKRWRDISRAYIAVHTTRIVLWLCYVLVALLIVLGFVMFYPRMDPETRERLRRSEHLMKHVNSFEERKEVLRDVAKTLDAETLRKGVLPCGTKITSVIRELIDMHRLHPEDGHQCLTAKHLGYPYAIISKLNDDGKVEIMFNPDRISVIDDGKVMEVNVTSDFFPLAPPVAKKRPMKAWISYIDMAGEHQRPQATDRTLHCILEAYEILTGQHYRMFETKN